MSYSTLRTSFGELNINWRGAGCFAVLVFGGSSLAACSWKYGLHKPVLEGCGYVMMSVLTRIIELFSARYGKDWRRSFKAIVYPVAHASKRNHSHPKAAANRNIASKVIDEYAISQGCRIYSVAASDGDQSKGFDGMRFAYTSKDACYRYFNQGSIGDDTIIKMSDVDYYVDMEYWMSFGRPIILWTMVPMAAARPVPDGAYTFDADGFYVNKNKGGSFYKHELWNYEADTLSVRTWYGAICYHVEHLQCPDDPTRRIIGLFPSRKIYGPAGWLMFDSQIKRRKIVWKGNSKSWALTRFFYDDVESDLALRLRLKKTEIGPAEQDQRVNAGVVEYISWTSCGSFRSAALPESTLSTAYLKFKRARDSPVASVETYLRSESLMFPGLAAWAQEQMSFTTIASSLIDAFEDCPRMFEANFSQLHSVLGPANTTSYTPYNGQVVEDAKPSARSLLPAGARGLGVKAVAPTKGVESDKKMTEGRVTSIRNREAGTLDDMLALEWFAHKLCETMGIEPQTLVPLDFDHVFERQGRPTQQKILRLAEEWFNTVKQALKTFMKSELYDGLKDPRNITTVGGPVKYAYSRYTYALQKCLKAVEWYAFSKNPRGIALAVNKLLRVAKTVVPTDFSRWDGRVSEWLTYAFLFILKVVFAEDYHGELEHLFLAQYQVRATTNNGVGYIHEWDMPSGSPHTSIFNTIMNAFVNFLALIEDGHDYESAWKLLGLYGGDDGLTADINPEALEKTCKRLGLSLKAKVLKLGDPVDFLGRWFLDAWGQCEDAPPSMIDVGRQLGKLYETTSSTQVPDGVVFARKAMGYAITDPNTPVLSEWSRAVLRLWPDESRELGLTLERLTPEERDMHAGDSHFELFRDLNWFATFLEDGRFNNTFADDGQATELVCQRTGFSDGEISALRNRLDRVSTRDEFFGVNLADENRPVKVEIPAVHGDAVLFPPSSSGETAGTAPVLQPADSSVDGKASADKPALTRRQRRRGAQQQSAALQPKTSVLSDAVVPPPAPVGNPEPSRSKRASKGSGKSKIPAVGSADVCETGQRPPESQALAGSDAGGLPVEGARQAEPEVRSEDHGLHPRLSERQNAELPSGPSVLVHGSTSAGRDNDGNNGSVETTAISELDDEFDWGTQYPVTMWCARCGHFEQLGGCPEDEWINEFEITFGSSASSP